MNAHGPTVALAQHVFCIQRHLHPYFRKPPFSGGQPVLEMLAVAGQFQARYFASHEVCVHFTPGYRWFPVNVSLKQRFSRFQYQPWLLWSVVSGLRSPRRILPTNVRVAGCLRSAWRYRREERSCSEDVGERSDRPGDHWPALLGFALWAALVECISCLQ